MIAKVCESAFGKISVQEGSHKGMSLWVCNFVLELCGQMN